jgi:5-methylcytosine-specific restriction endonuclease McrA
LKPYTKTYLDFFGYSTADFIPCEVCECRAVDVHHIEPKGMGGSKLKDSIENLIGLCRECHILAHNEQMSKEDLKKVHKFRMKDFEN